MQFGRNGRFSPIPGPGVARNPLPVRTVARVARTRAGGLRHAVLAAPEGRARLPALRALALANLRRAGWLSDPPRVERQPLIVLYLRETVTNIQDR